MDDSLPDDLAMYGDDPDAPLPQGNDLSGVEVAPHYMIQNMSLWCYKDRLIQRRIETKELMFIFKSGNCYCFIIVLQFTFEMKLYSARQILAMNMDMWATAGF